MKHKRPPRYPTPFGNRLALYCGRAVSGAIGLSQSLYALSGCEAMSQAKVCGPKDRKTPFTTSICMPTTAIRRFSQKYLQAIKVAPGRTPAAHGTGSVTSQTLAEAREGILQGGNSPEDVSSIIWFYRYFHDFSYMRTAIEKWSVGDQ